MIYAHGRIEELKARIVAVQIRVEGMLAENAHRQNRGETLAYVETHFEAAAKEVDEHAAGIKHFAEEP